MSDAQSVAQGVAQGQRIQAYCEILWGKGDYDLDIETDDYEYYWCTVEKDFGTHYGPPLIWTGLCEGAEGAWAELERMLGRRALLAQTCPGRLMTKEEMLEIFGGPNRRNTVILERFMRAEEQLRKAGMGTKAGEKGETG